MELTGSSWRCAAAFALCLQLVPGCASSPPAAQLPTASLVATSGAPVALGPLVERSPLTVLIFFSRHCECFTHHEGRLRDLHQAYGPRGVQFVLIDPEVSATPEGDAAEASRRGYPYDIILDRGALLANALGAEYATYTVVVDCKGVVRYRGGIDSDKTHLHDDATPYLRDALDDLLAGRPPRRPEAKTLGCALEKW